MGRPSNRTARFTNRRELLGALGSVPLISALSHSAAGQAQEAASGQPVLITRADAREFHRLRTLDLKSPESAAKQKRMPMGRIKNLSVSRLISGSNLLSLNMHARDLDYVHDLAAHYNTDDRVFMTLKKCEELGVNTIVLKNHNFRQYKLSRYWDEWGGQMQWIADVITTDIKKYEELLVEHLDLGASAAYLWGGAADVWYFQDKRDQIIKAFEIMKRYDIAVGIGAHRFEPIAFCEKEGLKPDFYIKTLHHDRYWSAHPSENRRAMEMYEAESNNHAEYHDNMFCHNHEETIAFMQQVRVPWIAFKVLAAGAIPPEDGIPFAFQSGADFLCVGMFDFQVEEDVRLVQRSFQESRNRQRPWLT